MAFNIGAGLSAAGGAIAQTAGTMAVEDQKAQLEDQKEQLINQLTTTRETGLESQREAGAQTLQASGIQGQIAVNKALTTEQITAHQEELTQDTNAAIDKIGKLSSPDMLAAQRAIAMASNIPNLQVQIGSDGTAMAFNPETSKVTQLTGADGKPISFQNPALAQAITAQTNTLKDVGNNLDRNYKSAMDAARVLNKDKSNDEQIAALKAVDDYYKPKMEAVNNQLLSLNSALGIKSGVQAGGAPSGAPSLDDIFGKSMPTTPGGGAGPANATGIINLPGQ